MKDEPFWCIPRNYKRYKEIVKTYDGYCYDCQKPMKRYFNIRCDMCNWRLIYRGGERNPVTFGQVGESVVNYQQYLHRSMFGINAAYKYRGKKEDRIDYRLDSSVMDVVSVKIDKYILGVKNDYTDLYLKCKDKNSNMPTRILYNLILYYTSYYVENSHIWQSEASFMSAVTNVFHHTIYRRYMQLYREVPDYSMRYKRTSYGIRYTYRTFEFIDSIMENVMVDLAKVKNGSENI